VVGAKKFISYLTLFNLIRERRKAMKKTSIAPVLAFVLLIAFASVAIAQMAKQKWEKTVTLPSGEVILDMSGEWDILSEFYGALSWVQPCSDLLMITQQGNTFSAVKQIGTQYLPKGTELIKGELDKDGFKEVQMYISGDGIMYSWDPCKKWEISENGNKIVFDDGDGVKFTLTRK
jgi:hypothetical protein